jgi:hypothetical protein
MRAMQDWNTAGQTLKSVAPCLAPGSHGGIWPPKDLDSPNPMTLLAKFHMAVHLDWFYFRLLSSLGSYSIFHVSLTSCGLHWCFSFTFTSFCQEVFSRVLTLTHCLASKAFLKILWKPSWLHTLAFCMLAKPASDGWYRGLGPV